MKDKKLSLNAEDRNILVSYRLEKALESLEQVKGVMSLQYWNIAANRLYYSAYYACSALLLSMGIETSTHKGVIRMINMKFVKEGILPLSDSQLMSRLFSMRQTGDYDDLLDWKEEDILPLIPLVEDFIDRIKILLAD